MMLGQITFRVLLFPRLSVDQISSLSGLSQGGRLTPSNQVIPVSLVSRIQSQISSSTPYTGGSGLFCCQGAISISFQGLSGGLSKVDVVSVMFPLYDRRCHNYNHVVCHKSNMTFCGDYMTFITLYIFWYIHYTASIDIQFLP